MKNRFLLLFLFICTAASLIGLQYAFAEEGEVLETVFVDSYPSLKELFEGKRNICVVLKNDIVVADLIGVGIKNDYDQKREVVLVPYRHESRKNNTKI